MVTFRLKGHSWIPIFHHQPIWNGCVGQHPSEIVQIKIAMKKFGHIHDSIGHIHFRVESGVQAPLPCCHASLRSSESFVAHMVTT